MIPTTLSPSVTRIDPTFISTIFVIASNTVADASILRTPPPFPRRISEMRAMAPTLTCDRPPLRRTLMGGLDLVPPRSPGGPLSCDPRRVRCGATPAPCGYPPCGLHTFGSTCKSTRCADGPEFGTPQDESTGLLLLERGPLAVPAREPRPSAPVRVSRFVGTATAAVLVRRDRNLPSQHCRR